MKIFVSSNSMKRHHLQLPPHRLCDLLRVKRGEIQLKYWVLYPQDTGVLIGSTKTALEIKNGIAEIRE